MSGKATRRRLRIFYIAQRVPFPPDRGDKIVSFHTVRHLARHHEVHIFCVADGPGDLANVAGLGEIVASVTAVPGGGWRAKLRALVALVTGRPLSVAMMDEPALHQAVGEGFGRLRPDLLFVFSSNVAQFAGPFAGTPRIMHFVDLDSAKWTGYARSTPPPMGWIYGIEGRRMLAYERAIAHEFSYSLVCTDAERADFEALIPGAPVRTAAIGVDLEYFTSAGVVKIPGRLVFTGVMDYLPNVDAVTWFARDILPVVRQSVPAAHFVICGTRPSSAVMALARLPGVMVTGRVPDVRPYLDQAEVFVGPLRIARGIQNKVLEAMAMGLPVVTTRQVWRGTAFAEGDGGLVADEAGEFAARVVDLLGDGAMRKAMGGVARVAVERDYTWAAKLGVLDDVIAAVMTEG